MSGSKAKVSGEWCFHLLCRRALGATVPHKASLDSRSNLIYFVGRGPSPTYQPPPPICPPTLTLESASEMRLPPPIHPPPVLHRKAAAARLWRLEQHCRSPTNQGTLELGNWHDGLDSRALMLWLEELWPQLQKERYDRGCWQPPLS
jgi:hypothetical protein